jgi:hypothetical protein
VIVSEDLHVVPDPLDVGERWRAQEAQRHVSPVERYETISSLVEIVRALSRR